MTEKTREMVRNFSLQTENYLDEELCCYAQEYGCSFCGQNRPRIRVCASGLPADCDADDVMEIVGLAAEMLRAATVEGIRRRGRGADESK